MLVKTYMFPGQGSQSKGMGGTLFDEFPELTKKADEILAYSIKELCLEDPRRELNKTQFTQPALYVVNALSYYKRLKETDQNPDYVIGHSLGEFNALLAAECFDFETGLTLVKKRGELMSQSAGYGMAAILNAKKEEVETILKENKLTAIDLANYNTPSQIVISGTIDEIGKAQSFFQQGKMLYYPLNTSGAFHSRYMKPAKEKFEAYLKTFDLCDLTIPVISNVTAKPYVNNEILENLSSQITSAVKWSESVQYLIELGIKKSDPMQFEELSNGEVLTKLVDKIKQEIVPSITDQPLNDQSSSNDRQVKEESTNTANEHQSLVGSRVEEIVNASEDNPQIEEVAPDPASKLDQAEVTRLSADDKVAEWNNKNPIGTKVKSSYMDLTNLETRTEAVVLFGHRAAVYMKDYNGYFDLDEVIPL